MLLASGEFRGSGASAAARQSALLTCAEFFAGIGLMRLGLERQGWKVAFANDIAEDKFEMYKGHFSEAQEHFVLGDIHKINATRVPTVTLATASFPCNDLSLAGAREGLNGDQSSAFWGFVKLLEEMKKRRPPIVLLENVVGFLTSHGGKDFEAALLALNRLGYATDAFILDAIDFVPQSRQRLFVVGAQSAGLKVPSSHFLIADHPARPKPLLDFVAAHPHIRWRLRSLPALPQRQISLEDLLEDLPDDASEWWSDQRLAYLLNQMSERHRAVANQMISAKEWSYGTVFRRMRKGRSMAELRTDGIAGCLRTPRGGSGRQILIKAGRGKCHVRLITPREAARLMGAGEFQLQGVSLNQALFGFGDAVCVPVIEWIAQHVLTPAANEIFAGKPPLGKQSQSDGLVGALYP
jgi:DNA (cytosine-5)-methyltransferase 1